jgi:hypothetical protein
LIGKLRGQLEAGESKRAMDNPAKVEAKPAVVKKANA